MALNLSQEFILGGLDLGLPLLQGELLGIKPLPFASLLLGLGMGWVFADGGVSLLEQLLNLNEIIFNAITSNLL